ncbi:IS110 family transposase [Streptomyces scopuliridis]|uniref:IS110 family transposase n=1 Tax=Streptomyces scopuliridis TaxID=452529 RepID=UPI003F57A4A1
MALIWAGTDIGKTRHHCAVLDSDGKWLLARRVLNDEPELLALFADVLTGERGRGLGGRRRRRLGRLAG